MKVIWERIRDKENVRHVQKGLQLFEFLVANGSTRVIEEAKDYSSDISDLKHYKIRDENGKDVGGPVRDLATKFESIISSDKEIDRVREEARRSKSKYQGISRDDSRYTSSYRDDRKRRGSDERRDSDEKRRDSEEKRRDSDDYKKKTIKRASFEREEEEEEEKPKVETKVEPKKLEKKVEPVPQKKSTDILFDDIFSTPEKKIDPFSGTSTLKTPQPDDFFTIKSNNGTVNTINNGFNTGGFDSDFDAKFETDFTDFQSGKVEEKKEQKNEFIDFTKGLVDLSLNEKKPVVKEEKKEEQKKTVLKSTPVMGKDAPWEKPGFGAFNTMGNTKVNTMGGMTGMNTMGGNTFGTMGNTSGFNTMNKGNSGFGTMGYGNTGMGNTGGFNNNMGGFNNMGNTGGFNTMGNTGGFNNGFNNMGGFNTMGNTGGFNNGFNNNMGGFNTMGNTGGLNKKF